MGVSRFWTTQEEWQNMPSYRLLQDQFANSAKQIPFTNHGGTVMVHVWVIYVTNLDMKMVYMSMPLGKYSRNIITLIMPFRLFKCLVLPKGTSPTMGIYQG